MGFLSGQGKTNDVFSGWGGFHAEGDLPALLSAFEQIEEPSALPAGHGIYTHAYQAAAFFLAAQVKR
jgi:hypothetical protein